MTTDDGHDSPTSAGCSTRSRPRRSHPVDVAAIYRPRRTGRPATARRWKRAAAAPGRSSPRGCSWRAVLPKLEVRFAANEFAVRWGPADPPPVAPTPEPVPSTSTDPQLLARVNELDARIRELGKDSTPTCAS